MNAVVQRTFEAKPAVREAVGLLISVVGPSSSGKTFSALRIASGIQQVVGGDIDVIDTENGRALYYADRFKFTHVRFGAPFSPLDYLEAIRYCARRGAKTVVIDSMSHEHEGSGGVLEWHAAETKRLAALWKTSEGAAQMAAWGPPKAARRKLINEILQLNINLVFTFRAKEKIKIVKGKDPQELGWQPICGDEFIFEMVLQCLLKPGSEGVPSWTSPLDSERAMMKLPVQFKSLFDQEKPRQIDEDLGKRLAEWAMGGAKPAPELDALIADYAKCTDAETFKVLEKKRAGVWAKPMPAGYKARVKEAADAAGVRIAAPEQGNGSETGSPSGVSEPPDDKTWIASAHKQTSVAMLDNEQDKCIAAYQGDVPLEIEDAFRIARENLAEAEAGA